MYSGQLSDEVLAARVAQGDKTAFETLYDRHASIILGIAFRIFREREAAEEVLQEIFWRIWQGEVTYQPKYGLFAGWLLRIARDLAIEKYRQRIDTNPILQESLDSERNRSQQPQSNFISQQTRNAMNTLPDAQRKVIELAYFQGMTKEEIAEATGESLATLHTRAREGLQKLREELERAGVEF